MFKKYLFDKRERTQIPGALVAVLAVAVVGTVLLVASHAATPYASINASKGTLSGQASLQTDSTASDGQQVRFGSALPTDGNVALALSPPGTPFAASSFWNTPLPASVPANPNNAAYNLALTYALCHDIPATGALAELTPPNPCTNSTFYGALNTSSWSAPLYVVPADQPLVSVESDGCTNQPKIESLVVDRPGYPAGVPVPADAHGSGETNVPDSDTDQSIQIYQPSTDQEWEFWRFNKTSGGAWEACVGGVITNVSQNNGIFPPGTGSTASGLPFLGGVVRIEELQKGEIDHAINLSTQINLSSGIPANTPGATKPYSWPANRNDGSGNDPLNIPEGLRFRLNPNLDISSLGLSPVAKTIAIAAQKYGFVVDESSNGVSIRMGDPTTYTAAGLPNPYSSGPGVGGVGTTGLFGNGASSMKNFPWNQLQALPFNYGQPGT